VVAITSGDRSPPVFWVPNGIAVQEAVPLARGLAGRSTFVPLAQGFGRPGRVAETVEQVVGDAVDALDADGPAGPVIVAAFSSACQQAQAVAARLVSTGRDVPLLVLLDPPSRPASVATARRRVAGEHPWRVVGRPTA
jgi:thioesterase domain-containing protein